MISIKFISEVGWAVTEKREHILVGYFIDDTKYGVLEILELLEKIRAKEITFEDVEVEYNWNIGSGSGEFSCDSETAYFTSYVDSISSCEISLQELIDILYKWKLFLGQ